MGTENQNWHLELDHDQWIALPVSGPRPSARYKHAATVVGEKLYIVCGSRNGRYLSDFQVFDLNNLTRSSIKLNVEPTSGHVEDSSPEIGFPAISSHNMIRWEHHPSWLIGRLVRNKESKSKSSSTSYDASSVLDHYVSDLTAKIRAQLQQEMDEKLDQKVQEMMQKLSDQNPVLKLKLDDSKQSSEMSSWMA